MAATSGARSPRGWAWLAAASLAAVSPLVRGAPGPGEATPPRRGPDAEPVPPAPAPRTASTVTLRLSPGATWDMDPHPTFGGLAVRLWGSGALPSTLATLPSDLVEGIGIRREADGVSVVTFRLSPRVVRTVAEELSDPPRLRLRFLEDPGEVAATPPEGGAGGPDLRALLDRPPAPAPPVRWGWIPMLVGEDSLVSPDVAPEAPIPAVRDGLPPGLRADLARRPELSAAFFGPPSGGSPLRALVDARPPPGSPPYGPELDFALAWAAFRAAEAPGEVTWLDAAALCAVAARVAPSAPLAREARAMAGIAYARAGFRDEAIPYLEESLAEAPDAPEAGRIRAALAAVRLARGASEADARALAGLLPALPPEDAFLAARFLAWTRMRDGRPDQGAAILDAIRPRWSAALALPRLAGLHAEVYYRAGRWADAQDLFARAAERDTPLTPYALSRRVDCAAALSDREGLVQARRALVAFEPTGPRGDLDALRDLAELREVAARLGDGSTHRLVTGLGELRRVAARGPGGPAAVEEALVEAELALRQGDLHPALDLASRALRGDLPAPLRARWRGWLCGAAHDRLREAAASDDPAEVARVWERAIAPGPDEPCDRVEALPLVAAAYQSLGLPGRAAEVLAPALARPLPDATRLALGGALARALLDEARPTDAEQVAGTLLEGRSPRDPGVAELMLVRGRARLALGRTAGGEADLEAAVGAGAPGARAEARRALAAARIAARRFAEAAALLAEVVGPSPFREARPEDLLDHGRCLLRSGRPAEALSPLAAAMTRSGDGDGAGEAARGAAWLLAQALEGAGRAGEARALLIRTAEGEDAWARLARGRLAEMDGASEL